MSTYTIDRKAASKLLKVSMRTVDRYIKSKKLSTKTVDGRVWLDKREVSGFKQRRSRHDIVDKINLSTPKMSIDNGVDKVDKIEVVDNKNVHSVSTPKTAKNRDLDTLNKIIDELKIELKEKQTRLEIANYRVGQLEAIAKSSMPMLEYHREKYEKEQKEIKLQTEINSRDRLLKKIAVQLKHEKINKRIFLVILLTILALQPLWLLFIYK